MLGSLTRIETARLGSAGAEFGNLAEEVTALTMNIEASGQGILEAATRVHQSMQSALTRVAGLRASELRDLPSLISEVMTSLASLEDRHRRATEASLRQAEEYQEVSAAIGDLITAIQFHDITRQQIEHVEDALERLRAEFEDRGRVAEASQPPASRLALKLQASQLSNAKEVFASSVGRIEGDLDRIAERVLTMAAASRTLMGSSADEQDSFFLQMESRLTSVSKLMAMCDAAEGETQLALAGLKDAVARMRASVEEVREVEIRIRRIAINATIRAVQIGRVGGALNVLAEVMHGLGLGSTVVTDRIAEALDTIADEAGRLSDEPAGAGEPGPGDVSSGIEATILELHSSSENSFIRLQQISALSARLGDEIQSVRAGFLAGRIFAEGIQRALRALDQMAGEDGTPIAGDIQAHADRPLDDFAKHYTMQSERDVHRSVTLGVLPAGPVAPEPPAAASSQEDLGANVELF